MSNLTLKLRKLPQFFCLLIFATNSFGQQDTSRTKSEKPKLIRGDVFIIKKTTAKIPKDFTKLRPLTTIYVSEINVPYRWWHNGFPDLPEIFEWFAIEYKATIRIKSDDNFKFRILSDDGAKLYIDDKKVVDNDGLHSLSESSNTIKLTKGNHSFKLQYFQGPRYEAAIQLFVKKDRSDEVIFPGEEIELISDSEISGSNNES